MAELPLIIKGYYSNAAGTNDTIATMAAATTWSNTLEKNRGDLVALDVVKTGSRIPGATLSAPISVAVGGESVIDNVPLNNYLVYAHPCDYPYTILRQPGGQTLQFVNAGAQTGGAIVHAYYSNPFATPEIIAARSTASLKNKVLSLFSSFASNVRASSGNLVIPTGRGNVVGIEITSESVTAQDTAALSLYSLVVDGVRIIDSCSALVGDPQYSRCGLIWPVLIRPGATIEIFSDATRAAAGQTYRLGVNLYFDDAVGTMPYNIPC